jgi:iron complex outermembrane recepter protein
MHQNGRGQVFGPLFAKENGHAFGRSEQWHEQWSVFAQANWNLTDRFTLVTGARYTDEQKDFLHCGVGFGDAANQTCFFDNQFLSFNSDTDIGDGVKANGVDQNDGTNQWSNLSPKVALNFQVNDNMFTYASWTRGFRSGGFNGRGNTPQTAGPFNEEKADSFEAGIKWDGMDNRLRVNLVGFWTEFSDLQRSIIRPSGGSGGQETVTENAAKARSRGFELEVTAIPTDGLTIGMAMGYLDASTLEWCADLNGPLVDTPSANVDCGEAIELGTGTLQPFDNSGMPILRAPKWTMNLNVAYEFTLGNNGFLTVSADYLHRTSMSLIGAGFPPGDPSNLGKLNYNGVYTTAKRKATDMLNLQATWEDAESRYHVSVFWKNVTKETYINSGTYVAGLFNFAQRNVPRHWGIEVGFSL